MSEEPFVPFYAPYGMSDEEYQHERQSAQKRHDDWVEEQMMQEVTSNPEIHENPNQVVW